MREDNSPEPLDAIPPRTVGSMASMVAALTGLVLVSILAFWLIGTQAPTTGNTAPPEQDVLATEQARRPQE